MAFFTNEPHCFLARQVLCLHFSAPLAHCSGGGATGVKGRGGVAREVPGARGAQQKAQRAHGAGQRMRALGSGANALSGLKGLASNALHASSGPVPTTTTWSICTLAPPSSSSVFFSVDFTTVAPLAAGAMPLKPRAVMGAPLRARPPSAAPAPKRFAAGAAPAPPSAAAAGVNTKPCAGHVSAAPAGVSSLPSAYAASSSREEILEGNKRCTAADGNIEAIGPAGHDQKALRPQGCRGVRPSQTRSSAATGSSASCSFGLFFVRSKLDRAPCAALRLRVALRAQWVTCT